MSTSASQTSRTPRCPNHPPMSASLRCDNCRLFLCRLCVNKVGTRFFCAKCGMLCRLPSPEELGAALDRQTVLYHASSSHKVLTLPPSLFGPQPLTGVAEAPVAPASQFFAPAAPPVEAQAQPDGAKALIPFCERKPPFYCKNHAEVKATRICDPCQEFFCNACAKMVEDNPLCPDCAAQLKALAPEEQEVPPLSFAERAIEALAYPLRGSGKLMLIMGAVFFWAMTYAFRMSKIAGLPGWILALGYMYAYFAKVCRTSAMGRESPPDWPGMQDSGNALYFIVVKLLSIAPALLYLIFVPGLGIFLGLQGQNAEEDEPEDRETAAYKELAKDRDLPVGMRNAAKKMVEARKPPKLGRQVDLPVLLGHIGVALVLYAVGSFCLPMALLAMLLHRSFEVLNPAFVLYSILRVPREYLLAYGVLIVTDAVGFFAGQYCETIAFVGPLFGAAIWLYLMMSQMYVLGRLYHLNQKRLAWFG